MRSSESQRLWMQGVALISKGKAERRHDMSCYGYERQN
nr:MAG TPA: hypothetical protein [Caudoviricetes sp.]DAZ61811.1 MAG TPA: hypothetical protein [Caudoviricetes sp.]